MRHRVQDKKFNRDANERKALISGMLRNLTEHGEITTTLARAKMIKRLADKLITQAKVDTIASRRLLHRTFGKRDVVNTLVERVAPALKDRNSGYTRIVPMGTRRGDNTEMVRLSWVNLSEKQGLKSGKEYKEKAVVKVAKVEAKAEVKAEKSLKAKKVTKLASKK